MRARTGNRPGTAPGTGFGSGSVARAAFGTDARISTASIVAAAGVGDNAGAGARIVAVPVWAPVLVLALASACEARCASEWAPVPEQ